MSPCCRHVIRAYIDDATRRKAVWVSVQATAIGQHRLRGIRAPVSGHETRRDQMDDGQSDGIHFKVCTLL